MRKFRERKAIYALMRMAESFCLKHEISLDDFYVVSLGTAAQMQGHYSSELVAKLQKIKNANVNVIDHGYVQVTVGNYIEITLT
jgi:hypothetical protein